MPRMQRLRQPSVPPIPLGCPMRRSIALPLPAVLPAFVAAIVAAILPAVAALPAAAQAPAAPAPITDKLRADAAALGPLVTQPLAREFLSAAVRLAEPGPRVVYRDRERGLAITPEAFAALGADEQAAFTPREYGPDFYYETAYGSPLVYARLLDLAAPHLTPGAGARSLDFGYGSIGQLQLLAHCGFDAHGVDIEPVFPALYREPGDTGAIGKGRVTIHAGRWPAEPALREAIGGGHRLITSKNTLKNGYLHPAPPAGQTVDPRRLLHLGVDDAEFLRRVHDALEPGGVFVIYNICPPQNPPDQEWLPFADGTCPFPRPALEKAGFEVLAFDALDQEWVLDCFEALGYGEGKTREALAQAFFCWYTILRRPAPAP